MRARQSPQGQGGREEPGSWGAFNSYMDLKGNLANPAHSLEPRRPGAQPSGEGLQAQVCSALMLCAAELEALLAQSAPTWLGKQS